jgi:hypothetical protein
MINHVEGANVDETIPFKWKFLSQLKKHSRLQVRLMTDRKPFFLVREQNVSVFI